MKRSLIEHVPKYYQPFVKDCTVNTYGSLIAHLGYDPDIILTDYLSFMYEEQSGYIGSNHLYKYNASFDFSEEELNSSLELAYISPIQVYDPLVDYPTVEKKDTVNVRWFLQDDYEIALARLKEQIDAGRPVSVFVDMFFMPYHEYYQKTHMTHSIVVVGYDDEQECFNVFDVYKIGQCEYEGTLSYELLRLARGSEVPIVNPMAGEQVRRLRNLWVEIDADPGFQVDENKLYAIIQESCKRMSGEREVLGQRCGLARMEVLQQNLIALKDSEFDERVIFMLKQYYLMYFKHIQRDRQRFKHFIERISHLFHQETVDSVCESLQQASLDWSIVSNICLKAALSKRKSLLDDLVKKLSAIHENEAKAVSGLQAMVQSFQLSNN